MPIYLYTLTHTNKYTFTFVFLLTFGVSFQQHTTSIFITDASVPVLKDIKTPNSIFSQMNLQPSVFLTVIEEQSEVFVGASAECLLAT